jgi:molybdopterin molybdotransferase
MSSRFIGYKEALDQTLSHLEPLGLEERSLSESIDYVVAEDIFARVDSPSDDTSLKDGFAVRSEEIAGATSDSPVNLKLQGVVAAGAIRPECVKPGAAFRILTGAVIPQGADAVVAEEYTRIQNEQVTVFKHAEPGRNILPKGCDVSVDELVIPNGSSLSPGKIGILAAAGHDRISVVSRPSVAIIATGDEVLLPGQPLSKGKLFASNMFTLNAWCRRYGMETFLDVVGDDAKIISDKLNLTTREYDAVLTSGGAWSGDRDLVARMLNKLGWQKMYHRVRIGPGKAIGFGLLNNTPVFILPGGPPSNLIAFLQLALPGLLRLAGNSKFQLPRKPSRLAETVTGQNDWTQFFFGRFENRSGTHYFRPLRYGSRLKSMAEAEGIMSIPEGTDQIAAGTEIMVSLVN